MHHPSFSAGIGYCIALPWSNGEQGAAELIYDQSGLFFDDFELCSPEDKEKIEEMISTSKGA